MALFFLYLSHRNEAHDCRRLGEEDHGEVSLNRSPYLKICLSFGASSRNFEAAVDSFSGMVREEKVNIDFEIVDSFVVDGEVDGGVDGKVVDVANVDGVVVVVVEHIVGEIYKVVGEMIGTLVGVMIDSLIDVVGSVVDESVVELVVAGGEIHRHVVVSLVRFEVLFQVPGSDYHQIQTALHHQVHNHCPKKKLILNVLDFREIFFPRERKVPRQGLVLLFFDH